MPVAIIGKGPEAENYFDRGNIASIVFVETGVVN